MKAHIILAHPEKKSFNGRLAELSRSKLAAKGWERTYSDLYTDNFDPREGPMQYRVRSDSEHFHAQTEQRFNAQNGSTPGDVAVERDRLLQSDLLILHFPLWWFGVPAILKGWIDRVFVYGSVYKSQMRYDAGICRGKKMLACITTGASLDSCSFDGREGDTRLLVWPTLFCFRYIGFDVLEPAIFHGVGGVASMEAYENGRRNLDLYARKWCEVLDDIGNRKVTPYNRDGEFDERMRLSPDSPSYSPFISHEPNTPWD